MKKQECTRCVMDSSAANISFDEFGVCNYCRDFEVSLKKKVIKDTDKREVLLTEFVKTIKRNGKGKRYDCIVGVSGGVDSSWVLVKAVELGLRPLAVHMDNGWNSELAQNNIEGLINGLGVDLYTYVIDWPEYKALMQAFFDANVIDIELLYDNAMLAINYRTAAKYGVKYILSGSNQTSEGMRVPENWNWFKFDKKNIVDIARKNNAKLKTFPAFSVFDYLIHEFVRGIRWTSILDLMDYKKQDAMDELTRKYGYKPYPYKHYESVFTRFYQGHILPSKFGVDKRRLHHSSLIVSGQITREFAKSDLEKTPYPSLQELNSDVSYFLKKMNWTASDLSSYLNVPEVSHYDYKTEIHAWKALARVYKRLFGNRSAF